MLMRPVHILFLFLLGPSTLTAQEWSCYEDLKAKGSRLIHQRIPDYETAIRFYLAALNCPDRPAAEVDELPALIDAALQARVDQLNVALAQVEEEKQNTQDALDKANKLIDAFYFYADRFALAFKDNQFYYIDKKGDPVEQLGQWDQAEQFDESIGFAKVKKQNQFYLIDTFGVEYPLATGVGQLAPNIIALDLRGQYLDSIPEVVFENEQLKVLLMDHPIQFKNELKNMLNGGGRSQFAELPKEVEKLTNLTTLKLSGNQYTKIPKEIGKLTNLTTLDLSRNELIKLPREIGNLINLNILDLSFNGLTGVPQEFNQLVNLKSLSLSGNQLTKLPLEITQLTNLRYLELSYNQLIELPKEIVKLTQLSNLGLYENRLTQLPPELVMQTNLRDLGLSLNQFSEEYIERLRKAIPHCTITVFEDVLELIRDVRINEKE